MWRAHWDYCLTPLNEKSDLCVYNPFSSSPPCYHPLPLITLSLAMHLFINHSSLLFLLAHNTLLTSSYTTHSSCIQTLLPWHLFLPLPANTNGQRPSLVLTGLDDLGFAISIVTQASPVLTELYNWIYVFLTLAEFCIWHNVGFNESAECKSWWPQ